MELLEREIANYEKSGENVSDAIRIGIVLGQLPESPIKQHLLVNSDRLTSWNTFRDEVLNIHRAQLALGPTPMDLGALGGGGRGNGGRSGGKPWGKGSGKSKGG